MRYTVQNLPSFVVNVFKVFFAKSQNTSHKILNPWAYGGVLCLKAHSPVYCWHVLTCFLSVYLCFYCTSVSPQALKDRWNVVSLPSRWEIIEVIQSVLSVCLCMYVCVCEEESGRKAQRCYHLPHDARLVSRDGCFSVSLPWRGFWFPGSVSSVIGLEARAAVMFSPLPFVWPLSLLFFSSPAQAGRGLIRKKMNEVH